MDTGLFNSHALAATGEESTLTRKLKLNRLGILQFLFDERKLVITTSDEGGTNNVIPVKQKLSQNKRRYLCWGFRLVNPRPLKTLLSPSNPVWA